MQNKLLLGIALIIILATGAYYLSTKRVEAPQTAADYKNISYTIEGKEVKLTDGISETPVAPGSASKITTRYFGNELRTDLNSDGREDVVFLLTQSRGGSGTYFYVVAAVNTPEGYKGTDGYLLGDRIAPQSTNVSQYPKHVNVVVVNYADRASGEPMTTKPSVGKSAYLKLDSTGLRWATVLPPSESETL